jgi:hypothetical protein
MRLVWMIFLLPKFEITIMCRVFSSGKNLDMYKRFKNLDEKLWAIKID